MPAAALLALLLSPLSAFAVFNAGEADKIDAEDHFDREYLMALRSFAAPLEWERAFAAHPGPKYFVNAASLDCCELLLDQRLLLQKELNERLSFGYALAHRGDKDNVSLFQWLSLDVKLGAGFSAGIFGEPQYAKQDADIGFKLGYAPVPDWRFAVRANAVDFNFNERGTSNQSYPRKPATFDFAASYLSQNGNLDAFVELDMPLIRAYPDDGRVYRYRKTTARLDWTGGGGDRHWRFGYAYEFKREAEDFFPDTLLNSQDHHRRVHRLRGAVEKRLGARDRLEAGLEYQVRGGRSDFGNSPSKPSRRKRWELGPHARWRRTLNSWSVSELAVFLAGGENRRVRPPATTASQLETIAEARLGTGIDFLFGPSGSIGIYGTFDLDNPTSHPWDGGNIRAMFLF